MHKLQARRTAVFLILAASVCVIATTELPLFISNRFHDFDASRPDALDQKDSMLLYGTTMPADGQYHKSGILNPLTVEHRGYVSSGNISARTDTNPHPSESLHLDTYHSWVASQAEIQVYDLDRLYAINGSFDEGYPGPNINPDGAVDYHPLGWGAISNSTDDEQDQLAAYEQTSVEYVVVENKGVKESAGNKYVHHAGTSVFWNQTISNTPRVEEFILRFRYLYLRGPLGPLASDYPGNCSLRVAINDRVFFSKTLPLLESRGLWYDTGDVFVNYTGAPTTLNFTIGLFIDETLNLMVDDNYVPSIPDMVYITAYLDDVSLVGLKPPEFAEVEMEFSAEGLNASITKSGVMGQGIIYFETPVSTSPITVTIFANSSIRFQYNARVLSHYYEESSWTSDNTRPGVAYSISANESSRLSTYTYIGSLGDYDEFKMIVRHPIDWVNVSIQDPFLLDVTSECVIEIGYIEIDASVLARLGWWQIWFDSPNYIRDFIVEQYDPYTSMWFNSNNFRSTNYTRAQLWVGTETCNPAISNPLNLTWNLPNATVWTESSLTSPTSNVTSEAHYLASHNTTAGPWQVFAYWSNGTEVGFANVWFKVYHASELIVSNDIIQADYGDLITNFVTFRDSENGEILLDESSQIIANWSTSTIQFSVNLVKNRWEADFDTSDLDYGMTIIVIEASLPYYDSCSASFTIVIPYPTTLTLLASESSVAVDRNCSINLLLTDDNGNPLSNADIQVHNLPDELSVVNVHDRGNGTYTIAFGATERGTYTVTIGANKAYYQRATTSVTISFTQVPTRLSTVDGTSSGSQAYGQVFELPLRFKRADTYDNIQSALVEVQFSDPSDIVYKVSEINGEYRLRLWANDTKRWVLTISAWKEGHDTDVIQYVFEATPIDTQLFGFGIQETVYVDKSYTISFRYTIVSNGTGVNNAEYIVSGIEGDVLTWTHHSDGIHNVTIIPVQIGSYEVTIRFQKTGFRSAEYVLLFSVVLTPVRVVMPSVSWQQGQALSFSLQLVDEVTDEVITDASVSFRLRNRGVLVDEGIMAETGNGFYEAAVDTPWLNSPELEIEIQVEKSGYSLKNAVLVEVIPVPNPDIQLMETLYRIGIPSLLAFAGLLAVVTVNRWYKERKKREYVKAMRIRQRFQDAQNILGVLVLHKSSGLPIYSRAMKPGLDEGVVSAFISAISHFRAEFGFEEANSEYTVIPISDIIRVVPTRNLIFAMVTVSPPSKEQEERMAKGAKAAAQIFDDMYDDAPIAFRDEQTAGVMDALFNEYLDGHLIARYVINPEGTGFRDFNCVLEGTQLLGNEDSFTLLELARSMLSCGYDDVRIYNAIWNALENGLLVLEDETTATFSSHVSNDQESDAAQT